MHVRIMSLALWGAIFRALSSLPGTGTCGGPLEKTQQSCDELLYFIFIFFINQTL